MSAVTAFGSVIASEPVTSCVVQRLVPGGRPPIHVGLDGLPECGVLVLGHSVIEMFDEGDVVNADADPQASLTCRRPDLPR
jgi:hypothetical protein